ncbi:hypothetical protein BDQ17DRAFT_1343936 [Cyathus striatus]|nr:hypothetical protein BDQ17DRAFT_1343936 [Cyathus striatus]
MEKETASAQRRAALPQTILASVVSSLLKAKKGAAGSKSSTPQQTRNQDSPSNVAPNNTPTPIPNATSKTTTKSSRSTKTCPLCLQIPFHVRSKCPVTIGDVEAIKNRLSELQGATSGDGEHRTQIISKLQSIVDSKSKEGKPNNEPKRK